MLFVDWEKIKKNIMQNLGHKNPAIKLGNSIINHSPKILIITILASVLMIVSLLFFGFKKSIDFSGGTIISLSSSEKIIATAAELEIKLQEAVPIKFEANINDNKQQLTVKFSEAAIDSVNAVKKTLLSIVPSATFDQTESIGPQIGKEMIKQSAVALLMAFVAIFSYMAVRFHIKLAISGVLVLAQDVIFSAFFTQVFQMPLNLTMIAAFLTIIGYCINDTVVLYDRIRSNLSRSESVSEIIMLSVGQVLRRSIITSAVTAVSLVGIMLFSDIAIRNFAITVMFGIVIGTLGSIFVASYLPIYFKLPKNITSKKTKKDPMFFAS